MQRMGALGRGARLLRAIGSRRVEVRTLRKRDAKQELYEADGQGRRRPRRGLVLLGAPAAAWVLSCSEPPPQPPTAVIVAAPDFVCQGESFGVEHALHARFSAPRLNLAPVPAEPGDGVLDFRWSIAGDEHRVVQGDLRSVELVVALAGERPLHLELRVRSDIGGEALTPMTLPLVMPSAPSCGVEGCSEGFDCVELRGERRCVPSAECQSDADCGAEACLVCDPTLVRCVPREVAP